MGDFEMVFTYQAPASKVRTLGTLALALTAVIAVLMVTQDVETAREATGYQQSSAMPTPNVRAQISQQLQKYDLAIKRVDENIARSKVSLVDQSRKLGQATQLAVKMHDKLVHDHQALLSEAARSRAMKQLRTQLAAKQGVVAAERQRLQNDALQLAKIEQNARILLSPNYKPDPKELQAVAQEANLAPPPPLALAQAGEGMTRRRHNHAEKKLCWCFMSWKLNTEHRCRHWNIIHLLSLTD